MYLISLRLSNEYIVSSLRRCKIAAKLPIAKLYVRMFLCQPIEILFKSLWYDQRLMPFLAIHFPILSPFAGIEQAMNTFGWR